MARPREYDGRRVDTKVRLRPDHVDLIKAYEDQHGPGQRNKIIEAALDRFFGIRATRPKLAVTPAPDAKLGGPTPKGKTRTAPRLPHVGEEQATQSEARTPSPVGTVAQGKKTRVTPRSRR